jgi:hypothetical protein
MPKKQTPEEESAETPEAEAAESTKEQKAEKEAGTEKEIATESEGSKGNVHISEDFQREATALVAEYKDSKPCLEFLRNQCEDALQALREAEMNKKTKTKGKTPQNFTAEAMPSM